MASTSIYKHKGLEHMLSRFPLCSLLWEASKSWQLDYHLCQALPFAEGGHQELQVTIFL